MNAPGKHRIQIWNQNQHPFRHNLSDFTYTNAAIPNTSNVEEVLNWLIAVIYPNTKPAVATPGDLPLVGNTISDYRVVQDDGDGKAASYRWEQREGEVAPSWHKVYDMDWGQDSILAAFLDITQDLYVYKYGKQDLDPAGTPLTGVNAGQHVYGGNIANTNLTLHANSGDGVGAPTGYIQTENVRPLTDATYSLSTLANRFVNLYLSGLLNVGTLTAQSGLITDTSGAISFDNENLTTTGNIAGAKITTTTAELGQLNVSTNVLTSDTNIISMLAQTITGLVDLVSTQITVGNSTDFLKLTANNTRALYNASSGTHDFNAQNINNVNQLSMTTLAALNGQIANFVYLLNDITNVNASTFTTPSMTFSAALASGTMTASGLSKGGSGEFGNYTIDTKITSKTTNSNVILSPDGTGKVVAEKTAQPSTNNTLDLGATANRWANLYLGTAIGDGTDTMPIATLMSLRGINTGVASGMSIFWNGTQWVPSLPDIEIDHTTIQNLTAGDAGHTQFAMLAGRSGGQQIQGGTGASQDLTLESTSNASKGLVRVKDNLVPNVTSTPDLGTSSLKWKDLYASGENKGLRMENTTTANNFNVASVGREYFNTTALQAYVDAGTHAKYPVYVDEYTETAAGANQTLPFDIRSVANLTGALTSISDISINSGYKGNRTKTLVNKTGSTLTINNSATILTGTGTNFSLANNASITLTYNGTAWHVAGVYAATVAAPVVQSKTSTYTVLSTDDIVNCDTSGGAFTLNLFTAVGNSGKTLVFKKTNSNLLGVTIDASGTETIDLALTKVLYLQNETVTIYSNGTNWLVRAYDAPTVAMRYSSNNATNITTSVTDYAFTLISFDTHSTYNTTTGEWTCPCSGVYQFDASLTLTAQGGAFDVIGHLYLNGSSVARQVRNIPGSSTPGHTLVDSLSLVTGDKVIVKYQVSAGSSVVNANGTYNSLSIKRIV